MLNFLRYRAHLGLVKLILLLIFLINLGVLPYLPKELIKTIKEESRVDAAEQRKRMDIMDRFIWKKIIAAEEKVRTTKVYSPFDYFRDLKEIMDKERDLGCMYNPMLTNNLMMLMERHSDFRGKYLDYDQINRARELSGIKDPGQKPREELKKDLEKIGWGGVLKWFFYFYLKNLPLACILFLIWFFEGQKELNKLCPPKPLRFLLSLVFHPFIIALIFWKWIKDKESRFAIEAELRRTKDKLFVRMSDDEIRRIKEFSDKNLSLSAWRGLLTAQGLKPRHTLAAALAATLLCTLIPTLAGASVKEKSGILDKSTVIVQAMGQNLPRMQIDNSSSYHRGAAEALYQVCELEPFPLITIYKVMKSIIRLKEVFARIDHVPLTVVQLTALVNLNRAE